MKDEYRPRTVSQKVGYAVEEMGEVLAAIGKTQRWGFDSYNPELPEKERELNGAWIRREIKDALDALRILDEELEKRGY